MRSLQRLRTLRRRSLHRTQRHWPEVSSPRQILAAITMSAISKATLVIQDGSVGRGSDSGSIFADGKSIVWRGRQSWEIPWTGVLSWGADERGHGKGKQRL